MHFDAEWLEYGQDDEVELDELQISEGISVFCIKLKQRRNSFSINKLHLSVLNVSRFGITQSPRTTSPHYRFHVSPR